MFQLKSLDNVRIRNFYGRDHRGRPIVSFAVVTVETQGGKRQFAVGYSVFNRHDETLQKQMGRALAIGRAFEALAGRFHNDRHSYGQNLIFHSNYEVDQFVRDIAQHYHTTIGWDEVNDVYLDDAAFQQLPGYEF